MESFVFVLQAEGGFKMVVLPCNLVLHSEDYKTCKPVVYSLIKKLPSCTRRGKIFHLVVSVENI
jgi:hypothetical protein